MTVINEKFSLEFRYKVQDPFVFCVHHLDYYPEGNEELGPADSLEGRNIGNDFDLSNSWKMYHGSVVPGFPRHPHRGFETVTVVLEGFVDHFDSLGGSGRYGGGDVQWMTAGKGVQHSEMFPLINTDNKNTLQLFQIWLNLPSKNKFVDPYYKMLWKEKIPVKKIHSGENTIKVTVIAGEFQGTVALEPTPDSWAADRKNNVDIFLVEMEENTEVEIEAKSDTVNRSLYFYEGSELIINGEQLSPKTGVFLSNKKLLIENKRGNSKILLLQGEPVNEPVVQYGPYVMNTYDEIRKAYEDYENTGFGGWPWSRPDPVHSGIEGRNENHN